jgi:hypothetical protein
MAEGPVERGAVGYQDPMTSLHVGSPRGRLSSLDRRVANFKDGRRLMASPGYALDRALGEGWSTSQDTESSGRKTESERDAGEPAVGTAENSGLTGAPTR